MAGHETRFRITRAGVLNVWQYDDQVFEFADGRLLLRGANGAGKSKTMEMLLPFVLDGDKGRLTASGRHHTSLLWLLLDGYEGAARTGYVWVEFGRDRADGSREWVTCGVGMRATEKARAATPWFFTTNRRVGHDLDLENDAGPLSQPALAAVLEGGDGASRVFDSPRVYREHVGAMLFGLPLDQYEGLLRLLYWLRQPQVGEDIDPRRLAEQLVNALPILDADTLSDAGSTFDELEAFGEDIDRRARAATALADFVETYADYARSVVADRSRAALDAADRVGAARRRLRRTEAALASATAALAATAEAIADAASAASDATARIRTLEESPEARARADLLRVAEHVRTLEGAALQAADVASTADRRADKSAKEAEQGTRTFDVRCRALHTVTSEAAAALVACGADVPPAPTAAQLLRPPAWRVDGEAEAAVTAAAAAGEQHAAWAGAGMRAVSHVAAAVRLVEEARSAHVAAQDAASWAQDAADRVEVRVENARSALSTARADTAAREQAFTAALDEWRSAAGGVPVELPGLTREGLAGLEAVVAAASAPEQERFGGLRAAAAARRSDLDAALEGLDRERREIEAEPDPQPPPPAWSRDDRHGLPGAPLWRLLDFQPTVGPAERAGLEAALEGAGLLDAWVTPAGELLDAQRMDVVLRPTADGGEDEGEHGLLAVLSPDPAAASPVPAATVEAVLRSLALTGDAPTASRAAIGVDGTWRLGPVHGHTSKPVAQYVGASARSQERGRRLAALDVEIGQTRAAREDAAQEEARANTALQALTAWLRQRPRHDGVLTAWTREEERQAAVVQAEGEHASALDVAREARGQEATRLRVLTAAAERHGLPVTAAGLAARRELATTAGAALERVQSARRDVDAELPPWRSTVERARGDAAEAEALAGRARDTAAAAKARRAEHDELVAARGATVATLEARLAEQRSALDAAVHEGRRHTTERERLLGEAGRLGQEVDNDRAAVAAAEPARDVAYTAVRALYSVPGLLTAADVGADADRPPTDRDEIRALHGRASAGRQGTANAVLGALTPLQTGPASIVEPRLAELEGAFSALGRDGAGVDVALPELAARLAAQVAADRQLLTDRERSLFETHVLGELGDALRGVRRQAVELVEAMSDQLGGVSTSQGIRVRLRWRLRDDIPADARRAVELLGEASGALLPGERADLRDALHRLIDLSRAEEPEDSYTEHLGRALDYRQWFAFTVQYHRPESAEWRDLHRNSPLSQGEQKVLCYLPLFAAAAAHFTTLAGAAPHAPRFVLLDDAFPKIDVRTHPLLFGLLVDLDLDFVVTSERLWGTHPTVPSLAIYEALRNPAQRGIAQYEHRWDGRQLTAVGARG